MSQNHTGNIQPTIDNEEHDKTGGVKNKKVLVYGWDSGKTQKVRLKVDANGVIQAVQT